jgi:putative ABC transport system ATP-binding protein
VTESSADAQPGSGPAIVATDVRRSYELDGVTVPALRGVSLTIAPGDYLAIVGTSGSGKSTLMHLLGGLDRPTAGTLVIGGRDVASLTPSELARLRNETIGFVFQSFHLLARTTAQDNVALPLVYRGIGRRQRRARAAAMLERVGLAHRIDHRPNQMSGGEQQRVAIARALVTDPAVLLADEPTGNLDSTTGQSVLALLESLNADGVAVVLVTHDRDVAARARRQIVMRDGLIVPSDPPPADGPSTDLPSAGPLPAGPRPAGGASVDLPSAGSIPADAPSGDPLPADSTSAAFGGGGGGGGRASGASAGEAGS